MQQEKILFQDKHVKITNRVVSIKCYYFPFGNSKNIQYKDIMKTELKPLIAKLRIWGMSIIQMGNWYAGDCNRMNRDQYIAIYVDSCIIPCFTTQNAMIAYNIIENELLKFQKQNSIDQTIRLFQN